MIRNIRKLLGSKRKRGSAQNKAKESNPQETLTNDFNQNVQWFRSVYTNCSDVVFHEFRPFGTYKAMLIYIEGLANTEQLDKDVLSPLSQNNTNGQKQSKIEFVESQITASKAKKVRLLADCIESISIGNSLLLLEGEKEALSLSLTKYPIRSIEEPQAEKVMRGPREGFIESLQVNTALIRRTIKSPALKMEAMKIGRFTDTAITLAYIEGIAEQALIEEVKNRLKRIDIDGVLESNYIEELIEDHPFSPFPQILSTERPDVVCAHLLEGRAAILIDGTPFVLVAPITFFSLLQAADDYYERYVVGTFVRLMRYFFILVALLLPSIYVALSTFHQEMIPDQLLQNIAGSRETVPFPAVVEALMMEMMLEALREAGVRLPNQIGAAVSIVGGLVIGQAAVQAGLVSAPMVIVVATTGIASFLIPRYIVGYSIRFLRFPLMILAGSFGLLGIMLGILAVVIHLSTIRSFGEPYLAPVAPLKKRELQDVLWRAPLWRMNTRPHFTKENNNYRQAPNQKPGPHRDGRTEK